MITIERPYVLLFLFFLIPIALFSYFKFKKIIKNLGILYLREDISAKKIYKGLRRSILLRTVFRIIAWIFGILAFSGISWGTRIIPVQKNGDAVCFVYDISYSMNAKDCPDGLSRLDAVKNYTYNLLSKMNGISISVVLAKGDGVLAIPLTDDFAAIELMIDSLSPLLMTSAGSSIGKGVLAAINSFPQNTPQAPHIWVFTDCDETDTSLISSFESATRFGYPVTIVGFGKKSETLVLAGDGKTNVKTALREDKIKEIINETNSKNHLKRKNLINNMELLNYIAADSESSGYQLLSQLSQKKTVGESYEIKKVERYGIFIFLAILFFIASYFVSELNIGRFFLKNSGSAAHLLMIVLPLLFISCDSGKASVLKGTWSWYQKEYQSATGDFLRVYYDNENTNLSNYASFGLAATYIMQEEYDAALTRLEQIKPNTEKKLKSNAFYNMGIIYNRKGELEKATEFFKKAILVDASNKEAKINLEFTMQQVESRKINSADKEMSKVNIEKNNSSLENAIFTLVKEEEQKQWKKVQANTKETNSVDY